ncbi:hypothetical protein AMK26_08435 [Streptomyces sp. CB03234]|uniref:hypothetical protein n=1 Tax=Streptomyces sp. (strain CB03234) TaxID=1703937 RepID=UPI00093C3FE6|nr:hypothetical protein [Streptomyces sp. CB03234]OKK06095.1 hypothetical protein AMK26_08435 [Streptomyces sp. CB03234]
MEQLSAGKKLDQAFEKLGKEKSLSFELDLDTDAKTLKALDAASDPEPGEEMPDEAAELLSGAKISVTVQSKKPLDESGEKDFIGMAMKFSNADGDLVEYRVVGDYTYVRADMETIAKVVDKPLPPTDDLPPEAEPFKKVIEGEWVKFNTKELEKTGEEMGQAPGAKPSPEPTLDAKTQKKLVEAVREVIAREVDFKTAGGEDGTEHITATAPFRTLITELFGEIRPFAKDLPPGMELPTDKDLKDAPNAKVTADFTLKNGELTEVNIDLAKLAEDAKVKKLGVVLRMSKGQTPTAPAGATELNLEEIMGGLAGAMMDEEGVGEDGLPEDGFAFEEEPV